jgi:hypothetical protein
MEQARESQIYDLADGQLDLPEILIEAELSSAVNYASWQNSVPFLRSLRISNNQETALSGLRLELEITPAFAKPKSWTIDRIQPGDEVAISDRLVQLDPDYLAGLNEAERGVVQLRLLDSADAALAETSQDIRLLARDEWGGFSSMPAITAAFVMPNDPAMAVFSKMPQRFLPSTAIRRHSTAIRAAIRAAPTCSGLRFGQRWRRAG